MINQPSAPAGKVVVSDGNGQFGRDNSKGKKSQEPRPRMPYGVIQQEPLETENPLISNDTPM